MGLRRVQVLLLIPCQAEAVHIAVIGLSSSSHEAQICCFLPCLLELKGQVNHLLSRVWILPCGSEKNVLHFLYLQHRVVGRERSRLQKQLFLHTLLTEEAGEGDCEWASILSHTCTRWGGTHKDHVLSPACLAVDGELGLPPEIEFGRAGGQRQR